MGRFQIHFLSIMGTRRQRPMLLSCVATIVVLLLSSQAGEALRRNLRGGEEPGRSAAVGLYQNTWERDARGQTRYQEEPVDAPMISGVAHSRNEGGLDSGTQLKVRSLSESLLSGVQLPADTANATTDALARSFIEFINDRYVPSFATNQVRSPSIGPAHRYKYFGLDGFRGAYMGEEVDPFSAVTKIPWRREEADTTLNLKKSCSASELVIIGRYHTYALLMLIEELGGKNMLPHFVVPYETFSTDKFYFSNI